MKTEQEVYNWLAEAKERIMNEAGIAPERRGYFHLTVSGEWEPGITIAPYILLWGSPSIGWCEDVRAFYLEGIIHTAAKKELQALKNCAEIDDQISDLKNQIKQLELKKEGII